MSGTTGDQRTPEERQQADKTIDDYITRQAEAGAARPNVLKNAPTPRWPVGAQSTTGTDARGPAERTPPAD